MKDLIKALYTDRNNGREILFKKRFPYHYSVICSWNFPADFKFTQKVYHYINNDVDLNLGICKCGKRCKFKNYKQGYYKHCSNRCSQNDKHTIEQRISTNISKYGTDNPAKCDYVKSKQIKTNNIRYGHNSPSCVNEINKQQRLSSYITKKKRNTFNCSKAEELFYNYLIEHNIECERQYKSCFYPFQCDFYINTYDLYIEIQGNWTHGGDTSLQTHPHIYNPDDEKDVKQVNLWSKKSKYSKYYRNSGIYKKVLQRRLIYHHYAKIYDENSGKNSFE